MAMSLGKASVLAAPLSRWERSFWSEIRLMSPVFLTSIDMFLDDIVYRHKSIACWQNFWCAGLRCHVK